MSHMMKSWVAALFIVPMVLLNVALAADPAPATGTPPKPAETAKAKWYDAFTFTGSFRFRQNMFYTEGGLNNNIAGYGQDRYRVRYRMLMNFGATFSDFKVGIQLASGAGGAGTATSANQTYDFGFGAGVAGIRQAWASYGFGETPVDGSKMVNVTLGQFSCPKTMFRSVITWDSDISLTGAHVCIALMETANAKDKKKADNGFYINLLGLYINEANPGEDAWGTISTLHFKVGPLTIGGGFWAINRAQKFYANLAALNAHFEAFEGYLMFEVPGEFPMAFMAQMVANVGAGGKSKYGFLAGARFGKDDKKKGSIWVEALYYYLERAAWVDQFTDAELASGGFGTNSAGPELNWKFAISDNWIIGMDLNVSYRLGDQLPGVADHDLFTSLIFDIEFYW